MNKIIFFDINGTIIERDGRTDLPYGYALNKLLGVEDAMAGVNTSARSDKDVFMEVLRNFNREFTEDLWLAFIQGYREQLEIFKDTDVWRENVDVVQFLQALTKTDYYLSMITGELSLGAQYKLEKLGLWQYFQTGGFGEDSLTRFGIAEAALKKAESHFNTSFDAMYIIGDTLLDIRTARHIGAKVMSITTGSNTREELMGENPDRIVDTFEELRDLFLD